MCAQRDLFLGDIPIDANDYQQHLLLRFLENKFIDRLSTKPQFVVVRSIGKKSSHGLNLYEHTICSEIRPLFRDLR
jgi:hypothetical protein